MLGKRVIRFGRVAASLIRGAATVIWPLVPVRLRRSVVFALQQTYTVGVSGIVLNDRDEVLLLRHRFRESSGWELPGGFLRGEEDLARALARELAEETGLRIDVTHPVRVRVSKWRHLDVTFVARVIGGTLQLDENEILEARFFPRGELPNLSQDQTTSIQAAELLAGDGS